MLWAEDSSAPGSFLGCASSQPVADDGSVRDRVKLVVDSEQQLCDRRRRRVHSSHGCDPTDASTDERNTMSRHYPYVRILRFGVVVVAMAFAWASFALADEPTIPPVPGDQSVKERAVPRTGTQETMGKPRPNNQVIMRQSAGARGSHSCTCSGGTGGCELGLGNPALAINPIVRLQHVSQRRPVDAQALVEPKPLRVPALRTTLKSLARRDRSLNGAWKASSKTPAWRIRQERGREANDRQSPAYENDGRGNRVS